MSWHGLMWSTQEADTGLLTPPILLFAWLCARESLPGGRRQWEVCPVVLGPCWWEGIEFCWKGNNRCLKEEPRETKERFVHFSSSRIWHCPQNPNCAGTALHTVWGGHGSAGWALLWVCCLPPPQPSQEKSRATPTLQAQSNQSNRSSCVPAIKLYEATNNRFGSHLQAGCSLPSSCKSHSIQEIKRGISEAEHRALQRTLSIKNEERSLSLKGNVSHSPVSTHTHNQDLETRKPCQPAMPSPPPFPSLALRDSLV